MHDDQTNFGTFSYYFKTVLMEINTTGVHLRRIGALITVMMSSSERAAVNTVEMY